MKKNTNSTVIFIGVYAFKNPFFWDFIDLHKHALSSESMTSSEVFLDQLTSISASLHLLRLFRFQ